MGRRRTILENVAVVPAAARAMVFAARIDQFEIGFFVEHARQGGEKTRPAGAAFIFHFSGEHRQVTARAVKHAFAFFLVENAAAAALGALVAQHIVLRGCEALFPLGGRKFELVYFGFGGVGLLHCLLDGGGIGCVGCA